MAYTQRYNPDSLPAHAEPEQAAQILGQSSVGPPPRNSSAGYENKPVPPTPQPMQNMRPQQEDRYGGRPGPGQYQTPGGYGSSGGPPPAQQGAQPYHDPTPGRSASQRYDRYDQNPQSPRYAQGPGSYSQQPPPPPPSRNNYASPPPPQSYGQGPPPQGYHNRPPIPDNQRPPTAAPQPPRDGNDRDALWPLFLQVDTDRSGELDETELRRALVNGDYTAFDAHTVRMMIRMFDTNKSNTINFDEFCGLWGFLAAWRGLFDRFDVDRSGNISLREFQDALVAFGYRLGPQFTQLLFGTYARSHSRGRGDNNEREKVLSFDLFVQACISLKRSTDVFRRLDTDRDGYITISFEEYLSALSENENENEDGVLHSGRKGRITQMLCYHCLRMMILENPPPVQPRRRDDLHPTPPPSPPPWLSRSRSLAAQTSWLGRNKDLERKAHILYRCTHPRTTSLVDLWLPSIVASPVSSITPRSLPHARLERSIAILSQLTAHHGSPKDRDQAHVSHSRPTRSSTNLLDAQH
nr:programmed cell death protein 6 [Quercus suber]